jgi:non-heme chloroperoxidase
MTTFHELPDGARLAYDDVGSGRPVVLVHGMCMTRRFFDRNVDALADRFRVVRVDLRSHGDSPAAEGGNSVAQYARDLKHLLDGLGLKRPVLAGWSMGTLTIWELLRQFGADNIGGHVNISQGPSDLVRDDWPLGAFPLEGLTGLLAGAQADFRATMDHVIPLMMKHAPSPDEQAFLLDETCKIGANCGTLCILDQSLQDYRDVVGAHDIPTLLTWGRDEKLISVANGEWLAEHQQGAKLVMFEESGHCPMWEEPERFNQVVGDWIAALDG